MAEFAQLRKEKWTESLDALRKTKLLNSDELMKLVRKLHDFEYKIQSPNRTLEDVLGYIEYECLLLKTIQQRRMELKQFERTDEIDRFIFMEIQSQFGSAEINFRHKIEFWNSRLKFVADIVPVQDRENELNKTFKKALEYCGRGNFDLYKYVVSCQWSFLNLPQLSSKKNRKRKKTLPKDCPRLMSSIRDITTAALRNFDRRPEVYIWTIDNELRYLKLLKVEKEAQREDPKAYLQYDVEAEVEKTVGVVHVVYSEFLKVFAKESMRPYFQLYDLYTSYQDIPETKHLLHKINGDILSVEPRTSEIYEWLMNKSDSTDEDTIRKSLEIITEALSNMPTNAMLDICIGRVNTLLQQITASGRLTLLPQVLKFCSDVYSNEMWETCPSETYHISRIHFLKQIPNYIGLLETTSDSKTIEALESMYKNYPLRETTVRSLTKIPASFGLVKELVLLIISSAEQKFTRAKQVLRYLSVVDWKSADKEDAGKFLNFVYFAFVTGNVKVQGKVMDLLNIRAPPGIDDLRVCHLKKEYLEGIEKGRTFYKKFRFLTSSWSLACAVIEVETDYCVASGKSSDVLKDAIEDSMRLCGSSSIEPWISAILSHHRRKNEKTAKQLLRRALDTFSIENENSRMYKDLLLFSKQLR